VAHPLRSPGQEESDNAGEGEFAPRQDLQPIAASTDAPAFSVYSATGAAVRSSGLLASIRMGRLGTPDEIATV
jgi:hypothetical protein